MTQLTPAINSSDHIYGNSTASIELVEYGDYQCPYCRRAYPIVKNIKQKLGDDLRFVFRNFPLSKIHPHAFFAAVASEAAGLQGKFWEMHDILFEKQPSISTENIFLFAQTIGLDLEHFKNDIDEASLTTKVRKDFESGLRSGVNGTPSFYINDKKYNGSWKEDDFLQYLENMLKEKSI